MTKPPAVGPDKTQDLVFSKIIIHIEIEIPPDDQVAVGRPAIPYAESGAGHEVHILHGMAQVVRGMIVQHPGIRRPHETELGRGKARNPVNLLPVFLFHILVEVPVEKADESQHEPLVELRRDQLRQPLQERFLLRGHQLLCQQSVSIAHFVRTPLKVHHPPAVTLLF